MIHIFCNRLMITLLLLGCASCAIGQGRAQPEWSLGGMVVTANPHATAVAGDMLARGGHAVDAAIAAHAVLGLVEPQSSGLGGGGFMLVYERDQATLTFHDGRESAPAGADAEMFMLRDSAPQGGEQGQVMGFMRAWQSGLAVGVPGVVALYKQVHEEHGRLPWADLFQPAIELARRGFEVSPRLAQFLPRMAEISRLDENPGAKEYFFPGGEPLSAGELRTNPEYARTLTRIAQEGVSAFYTGPIAQAIADAARAQPDPGTLSVSDVTAYQAKKRPVVCGDFLDVRICGATPPSSGAATILMAKLYEQFAPDESGRTRAFVDAQRLAYADRDHFFGDPDGGPVPVEALLDQGYVRQRGSERFAPSETPVHGNPVGATDPGADTTQEASGTSHLSIVDTWGNAVSFTATVEAPFGSARWVEGFLLNNEMTDFARDVGRARAKGQLPANAIRPGLRPRSSMSPTMIFDANGRLHMVTGSPGGNSIPAYVGKTILGVLAWGLTPQAAVDFPNIVARGTKVRVETGVEPGPAIAAELKEAGYDVQERQGENSGISLIYVGEQGLEGAADKRREGTVKAVPGPPAVP